jgi:hypothetical protein
MGTRLSPREFVRVTVPGPAPRDRRCRDDRTPLEDALHTSQVLRGLVDLATLSEEHDDLRTRVPLEVNVGSRPDVIPPPMFGGGQSTQDIGGLVAVEERNDPEGVRIGVGEGPVGELLADESPDRVGAARAVPLPDPPVEQREQRRLQRYSEAHDLDGHGSEGFAEALDSSEVAGGDDGPNPMSS